jgi:hypothetical protein
MWPPSRYSHQDLARYGTFTNACVSLIEVGIGRLTEYLARAVIAGMKAGREATKTVSNPRPENPAHSCHPANVSLACHDPSRRITGVRLRNAAVPDRSIP